MRVLIATESLEVHGGAETHLRAVLPLLAADHELAVTYGTPPAPGRPTIVDGVPGVPAWQVGDRPGWRPDVVYQHGLHDPAVEADLAARHPSVLFAHTYHGTCVSGTKCHAARGYRTCTKPLGPGCLAVYLPFGCGGRSPLTMVRAYRSQRRRCGALFRHRAVLVASRHMVAECRRQGLPDARLRLVPYFPPGVTPDPEPPAPRPRTDRVLFVGRATTLKGLGHAVEAVGRAAAGVGRRLTLVVAGDGPDLPAARAAAAARGVPTEFLGWVGADRRTAEMRTADVLVLPSLWPEPFGLVGIEAGCVGLPAVGYATGGVPDWLNPGVSGESAAGGRPDPSGLAAALVRGVADDAHRQRLRVGAWEAAGRFTPGNHLAGVADALRAAAGGPGGPAGRS